MKKRRLVERIDRLGEKFIETPTDLWEETLKAWKADHTLPCPMPMGHMMFLYPQQHGMRLIK